MEQRLHAARCLPEAEQAAFFYCNGRSRDEFKRAVEQGEPDAVELALDVLAGEVWLRPGYARGFRAALRRAAAADVMSHAQRKRYFALESRYLERLEREGFYSPLSEAQRRAQRRLPWQRQWMLQCFGCLPELHHDRLPAAEVPEKALRSLAEHGILPSSLVETLLTKPADLLPDFWHCPGIVLPKQHLRDKMPEWEPDLICYHLTDDGTWCITPWRDVREVCRFSLAADGSCYCCRNEWDVVFAAEISCG